MIQLPDFLKKRLIDEHCPVHNKQLYEIDGRKMCQECQLIKAEKSYKERMKSNMDDERLKEYNEANLEKRGRKRSTLEQSGGDVVKKLFGGK